MRHVYVLIVAALALPLSEATAQHSAVISPGERVRLRTADSESLVGRVVHVRNDTLLLSPDTRSDRDAIPLRSITRIDVRQRATRTQGAWRWAKRGFVVGAVVGAVGCSVDVETCRESPEMSEVEIILGSALFLGGGVAVLGAVGGALFPGGYWERVPIPEHARIAPHRGGGLLVSLSWRICP
jgi:hypothetical protein